MVCSGGSRHNIAPQDFHFILHDAMDSSGIDASYSKVIPLFYLLICFLLIRVLLIHNVLLIWAFREILLLIYLVIKSKQFF